MGYRNKKPHRLPLASLGEGYTIRASRFKVNGKHYARESTMPGLGMVDTSKEKQTARQQSTGMVNRAFVTAGDLMRRAFRQRKS